MTEDAPAPRRGRRSASSHAAVLTATRDLLAERGYARLTIDGIAARSAVSKATVYRWWSDKAAVVVEAVLESVQPEVAFPDTGSVRTDLARQAALLAQVLTGPGTGGALIGLLARAQDDPGLAAALRSGWQEPRRDAGRDVVRRAVLRGELAADVDVESLLDAVYGAVYLRVLFGHAAVDAAGLADVVDLALAGAGAER